MKKPSCPPGILVDVSPTGMWSDGILLRHAKDVVCSRKETQFYRHPVLYIMDSYAAHIKMFNEELLKRYNVSFQAYYRTKYDGFMGQALQDTSLQTKAGNPKVSHYEKVAQWVLAWAATRTTKDIARAFQLCGLVAKAEFSVYKLHPPLRELLSSTVNMHEWHQWYQHIVDGSDDHEELCISPPGWYLPDDIHSSLFCCLRHSLGASYADYVSVLTDYMQ
ncbi:hypothetical protein PC110_g1332 [Phytophthora cactorum]|uniref:DDE-1 domain-containing protein n=1 Tax=Phytophthora cactorum TaxID=29920 RepID=A0A329T150_9STRA|nr:hypothetical protein PC110_g1332 [Phytophthora cactorum]